MVVCLPTTDRKPEPARWLWWTNGRAYIPIRGEDHGTSQCDCGTEEEGRETPNKCDTVSDVAIYRSV